MCTGMLDSESSLNSRIAKLACPCRSVSAVWKIDEGLELGRESEKKVQCQENLTE